MNSTTITTLSPAQRKVRENRVRRHLEREGFMLVKSRRRDPFADDYGLYVVVDDSKGNRIARYGGQAAISDFANGLGTTLEEVERQLRDPAN